MDTQVSSEISLDEKIEPEMVAEEEVEPEAVSYTHLTLPTILRV